jgi:hypothetical protein
MDGAGEERCTEKQKEITTACKNIRRGQQKVKIGEMRDTILNKK